MVNLDFTQTHPIDLYQISLNANSYSLQCLCVQKLMARGKSGLLVIVTSRKPVLWPGIHEVFLLEGVSP